MKEIGGDFEIITRSGEGCKVCLRFPIRHSRFRRLLYQPASEYSPAPNGVPKAGQGLAAKQIK
jgi:hypothetical protein